MNLKGVQMRSKRVVLTDTSALALLLRIAPAMFQDQRFNCAMPEFVYDEFIKKPEFKDRFPWRDKYKEYLRSSVTIAQAQKHSQYPNTLEYVSIIAEARLNRARKPYGLSKKDKEIVAVAIAYNYDFCCADKNLSWFAQDEFGVMCVSPLELVNRWLTDGLIVWSDALQALLVDWGGRSQPKQQIKRFHELTGYNYPV